LFKYLFNGIAGFATIAGAAYVFVTGVAFYVILVLSFLFTLAAVLAWYQSDRLNRTKIIVAPLLTRLIRNIGAEIVPIVAEFADYPGMRREIAYILAEALRRKPDPTERYWIYVALGITGGRKSKSVIKGALSDEVDEFALLGLKEACKAVNKIRGWRCRERKR
jgi:hypothetical protein